MYKCFTKSSFLLFSIAFSHFFFPKLSYAQENRQQLTIQSDSSLVAENGSIVALTLVIENSDSSLFTGHISLSAVPGINLLGRDNAEVTIGADSKTFYPIRLFVNNEVPAGESLVHINLLDSLGQVQAQFTSRLRVEPKREVRLINHRSTELMQHIGDSLSVSVLLNNQGNSRETITLTASFPDLRGGKSLVHKRVQLAPFRDTIVVFKRIISKELLRIEQYAVNVAALYANGDFINNVIISVQNVAGNRNYVDPSRQGYYDIYGSSNKISLSGSNLNSNNEALQLSGRGVLQMPGGVLDFSLNASQYTQYDNRPLVTNTYIDYELKNVGVMAGSISESLETFINGRGIKVYAKNEEETKRVELAIVDKKYNLLGDQYANAIDNGYTAYATSLFRNDKGGLYTSSLLYDRSPYEGSESMIAMNHVQYQLKNNVQIGVDLGGGMTRLFNDPSSSYKPSMALGSTLSGTFGKYSLNSNNFYSSSYYPGIRRGVLQLNERLSRNFNKANAWLAFSFYNYDPRYLSLRFNNNSNFLNSRIEGGASFSLTNYLNLSLSANKIVESGQWVVPTMAEEQNLKMSSLRFTEALSWRSKDNLHSIYLSSENGFSKSPITGKKELDMRANASWTFGAFNLNTYFQQGSFSVFEAMSNAFQGDNKVYRFSVSPGLRKNFLQNKLKTQLNMNYNRDSYSGENWMYSGMTEFAFARSMSAFVNAYFYTYKTAYYNSSSSAVQAGISYSLPDGRNVSPQKKGKIEIFMFYDNNTNGVFDEGDLPAEGQIALLGGVSFISQSNGAIEYKKVPYGAYSLRVPSQNWHAKVSPEVILNSRTLKVNVPLQRTGKITGKFYYHYDERTSMEVSEKQGGLRLLISGKNDFTSQALTNANGEFTLFLPVGDYELWVDENSLPKNVYTDFKPMPIHVAEGKPVEVPKIELKVKQRVIEVKRFSSE
jgi:hypothetical protein